MARYIDADELRRRVKEKTNPYGKPTLDYESGVKVLNMIDNAHTADVAPRAEVAREIFWEIDKLLAKIITDDEEGTQFIGVDMQKYYALKKKYTEAETGLPEES